MANEVKIDQEQFDRLVELLEAVSGHTDDVANYLERLNDRIMELQDTIQSGLGDVGGEIAGVVDKLNEVERTISRTR